MNHLKESSVFLKIGFRITEEPSAFTLVRWLPAAVVEHSADHAG